MRRPVTHLIHPPQLSIHLYQNAKLHIINILGTSWLILSRQYQVDTSAVVLNKQGIRANEKQDYQYLLEVMRLISVFYIL